MDTKNPVNQILVDKRMTQTELARELGVHRVHVSAVINGSRTSNPVKRKISQFFKIPENELFPEDVA
jgi:transcriptional regulator with XRE-family HTH domain